MIINGSEVEYTTLDEAIYSVADLVLQFGYRTKFRNRDAVCAAGLSALQDAFSALERAGCKMNSNGTIQVKNLLEFMNRIEPIKTPKKPVNVKKSGEDIFSAECPSCGYCFPDLGGAYEPNGEVEQFNFCPECGQKIDWDEEKS